MAEAAGVWSVAEEVEESSNSNGYRAQIKNKGGRAHPALPWTWCSGRCTHSEVFLSSLLSHVSDLSGNALTDIQGKLDRLWYLYIQSRWQPKQTITHDIHSMALEGFPQGVFSISSLMCAN